MTDEEATKRVAMLWPESLEAEVREKVGNRGRTEFAIEAVRNHLRDHERIAELEKELNEARYSCQLFADQLVMGGDREDRAQRLLELEFPHWISTDGWPAPIAERVRPEPLELAPAAVVPDVRPEPEAPAPLPAGEIVPSPVTAPDPKHNHEWERTDGILCCACGAWIDETVKPGVVMGNDGLSDAERAEDLAAFEKGVGSKEPSHRESTIDVPAVKRSVPKSEPGRSDLFARIMEKTGGAIDPGFRDLQVASELSTPVEKPALEPVAAIDVLEAGLCPVCKEELIDGECWTCG